MGLPLLDCFLNGNGTALAQGAPLPVRFGAWMWGCGMNPDRWNPPTEGVGYDLSIELQGPRAPEPSFRAREHPERLRRQARRPTELPAHRGLWER